MKIAKRTITTLVTTYTLLSLSPAQASVQVFTAEQEAQIGKVAADYLVAHPEILITVTKELRKKQLNEQQKLFQLAVMQNQKALLDMNTPHVGPNNAKVALIEFFDYQCIHCSNMQPSIERIMKDNPDVRYVFHNFPVFAERWENSRKAAERGLSVWQNKGGQAFIKYHQAVYATGHIEGALTAQDIESATKTAGAEATEPKDARNTLADNMTLAQEIGFTGTPGFIIMPISNPNPASITVIPGTAPIEDIQKAIDKAKLSN